MYNFPKVFRMVILITCLGVAEPRRTSFIVFAVSPVLAIQSAEVREMFKSPAGHYSSAPFWVWNDMMTEELVIDTLNDLASQKIKQVFVHPRPGLMTPYLSQQWFGLWKIALQEAERLDMSLWIYDENSYPSGFAGGFVPEAMPESQAKGLIFTRTKTVEKLSDNVLAVFRLGDNSYENVTEKVRADELLGESEYLIVSIKFAEKSPWFGGKFYVDLLKPGVTQRFLEITLNRYQQEFGSEFGKRILGIFTDEPRLGYVGECHWTDDLPEVFEKKWGYSLIEHLPCLVRPVGDFKRVRHNYFQVLLDLFIDRWAKPYYEHCEKLGLEFTGHYWEHEWPGCTRVSDNMALSAWQHRPGIDILFNQYSQDVHSQFGNIRSVMELASVANQLGRKRSLCEAYGGGGWDLRFEDMKRIGDWLFVLGVNTLNEHLSYISIRGARKADYPQSFSYHQPWWGSYHVLVSYFTRLSAAMSAGEQINKILVIEPTTTAWMYQVDQSSGSYLDKVGSIFQKLVVSLANSQVEFDIGCEDIIARHGSVQDGMFIVGQRRYSMVVLPPMTENLNQKTMDLIDEYLGQAGKVICCGPPAERVDGIVSQRCKDASQQSGWQQVEPVQLPEILLKRSEDGFAVRSNDPNTGILLHHRRILEDGQLVFVTNTSINQSCSGVIRSSAQSAEQWNPQTGETLPYSFKLVHRSVSEVGEVGDSISMDFELAPCGSLLLFLSDKSAPAAPQLTVESSKIQPEGKLQIRRIAPNVLTLDYLDLSFGKETIQQIYYHRAAQMAFVKHGLWDNPWDHAVQFCDELISKKFAPDSGFEATYRFTIKKKVPKPLYIVIERPDLYTITCNAKPVTAQAGSWWLDKSFGKIDISSAAKKGENKVVIKATPFTVYHEIAAAYVLGGFTVKAEDAGFVIMPDEPLKLGPWDKQGHQFYAQGVSYTQRFNISRPTGRYFVRLGDLPSRAGSGTAGWYGSVAEVVVNGSSAGYIYHRPWQCDVTEYINEGTNEIEVIVTGTLKNTLGPHHGRPPLGFAAPDSFRGAPSGGPPAGEQYHTVGYGLFEPFELHNH
jgi:hypothetical protein